MTAKIIENIQNSVLDNGREWKLFFYQHWNFFTYNINQRVPVARLHERYFQTE
jgi:hypothetical protein